jgi:hypothetical protein
LENGQQKLKKVQTILPLFVVLRRLIIKNKWFYFHYGTGRLQYKEQIKGLRRTHLGQGWLTRGTQANFEPPELSKWLFECPPPPRPPPPPSYLGQDVGPAMVFDTNSQISNLLLLVVV